MQYNNLNKMKKRECFIPYRQINWKKYAYLHNKENNIFYDCQCGKRYISFPAIYLHFQRKHKTKLSTRQESPQCQARNNGNQLVYFYFVRAKRQKFENKIEKESKNTEIRQSTALSEIFSKFKLEQSEKILQLSNYTFCTRLLHKLESYMLNCQVFHELYQGDETQLIQNMVHLFNDFIIEELNKRKFKKVAYQKICLILHLLSNWLYRKNISKFFTELNFSE